MKSKGSLCTSNVQYPRMNIHIPKKNEVLTEKDCTRVRQNPSKRTSNPIASCAAARVYSCIIYKDTVCTLMVLNRFVPMTAPPAADTGSLLD